MKNVRQKRHPKLTRSRNQMVKKNCGTKPTPRQHQTVMEKIRQENHRGCYCNNPHNCTVGAKSSRGLLWQRRTGTKSLEKMQHKNRHQVSVQQLRNRAPLQLTLNACTMHLHCNVPRQACKHHSSKVRLCNRLPNGNCQQPTRITNSPLNMTWARWRGLRACAFRFE